MQFYFCIEGLYFLEILRLRWVGAGSFVLLIVGMSLKWPIYVFFRVSLCVSNNLDFGIYALELYFLCTSFNFVSSQPHESI